MMDLDLERKVDALLQSLEATDFSLRDLGTPQPVHASEVEELVCLGPEVIAYLIQLLNSASPKRVLYVVLVLGKLGDAKVIEPMKALRSRYQALEPKTECEYAVIGQCNLAIRTLEQQSERFRDAGNAKKSRRNEES